MPTQEPHPSEESLKRIEETLEETVEKMDDLEHLSSDVLFKPEEMHDDVRELQGEVAEVKDQVDDLYSEDR